MKRLYAGISITLTAMSLPLILHSFDTVQDLLNYAATVEEFPDSDLDSKGILAQDNPTFHAFYATIDPNLLGRIACKLNIFKPLWCFDDFVTAMQNLYKHEQKRPWFATDTNNIQGVHLATPHLIGYSPNEHPKIIVVGELSGAFHSLAYITSDWQKTGIINTHFVIQDPNTHIVFLGDLVGTSAYNLEMLTAISTILTRNPEHAWYLCGSTEDRQRWSTTPLHHAIEVRSRLNKSKLRTIYQLVNNVFA